VKRLPTFVTGFVLGALAFGSLTTSAAGPYVFGCGPMNFFNEGSGGTTTGDISIYNGSATTANLTVKILAGDGTQLGATVTPAVPTTSALGATKTATIGFTFPTGTPSSSNGTVPNSVRIVSDVLVAPTLALNTGSTIFECTRIAPE
jgi:hypothetical protein